MRLLRKFVQYPDADILSDFPSNKTTTMVANSRTSEEENSRRKQLLVLYFSRKLLIFGSKPYP